MVIYLTVNKTNGKWYIGKDAADRAYYLGSGKAVRAAIKKYGKLNFEKIILERCSDLRSLSEREKHWIKITNAVIDPMSYNLAQGGEGGNLSKYIDYSKIDYSNHSMLGTKEWYQNLSEEQKEQLHAKQAESRSQVWYISKVNDPTETRVKNIAAWCRQNGIGTDIVSNLTNPKHRLFQKQTKGWRFRKEGQDKLPEYINNRKKGHPNVACKGKSWKLINGTRVWFDKKDSI